MDKDKTMATKESKKILTDTKRMIKWLKQHLKSEA